MIVVIKNGVNNFAIPTPSIKESFGSAKKVLCIFPHPDDEIAVSGTLAMLHQQGYKTGIYCTTNGDGGGRSRKDMSIENHIAERQEELSASAKVLGVNYLKRDTFSNVGFSNVTDLELDSAILMHINTFQPDILVTFDHVKGLYGHPDHIRSTEAVLRVCKSNNNLPVEKIIGVTLPKKLTKLALKYAPSFKRRFYRFNKMELPQPEFAIKNYAGYNEKELAIEAYQKRKVIGTMMPLRKYLPKGLFHFIHDRDYFYTLYEHHHLK